MKDLKRSTPELPLPGLQFVMIAALFVAAIIVLLVWHPWQSKVIRGLPTEVAPTTAPHTPGR